MAKENSSSPYSLQNTIKVVNNNFGLLFLGAALLLLGFVFGSLWTENRMMAKGGVPSAGNQAAAQPAAPQEAQPLSDADWKEVQENGVFTVGDKNAKVTMVEFTDYQCPFCSRHYTETHGKLMTDYVDAGKLKIIYHDQALPFHPNASIAAQAVRCAADQNKAEAMHDALFANQDAWANLTGDAVAEKFSELANQAGLNGSTLASCASSGKYQQAVKDDGDLGTKVGANGTPTFFVEGKPVVGAQPYSVFQSELDALL